MKKEKKLKKNVSVKESGSHQFRARMLDALILVKEWLTDYGRVILPIIFLICISVTFTVALNARSQVEAAAKKAEEALQESKTEVVEVVEQEFEINAIPEINAMFTGYYSALRDADTEALEKIQGTVSETEKLRLQAMGPYIEKYDNIVVYTKPGPYLDTYICYVTVDVYLKEQEASTPGLQAFYVCMNDEGNYYINSEELTKEEADYIENIISQADVIDLKNTINVLYSEIMEENEDLKNYWAQISVEIDSDVGETLTEEAVLQAKLEEEEEAKRQAEEENDPNNFDPEAEPEDVVIKAKTNEMVNIRKSASATADKLGTASLGDVFVVLEVMNNGWTKIDYGGTDAYIKSEFLDEVEDASNYETVCFIQALSALNVRSAPNATAARVGILNAGDTAELIEEVDDWSKIKFNGGIAYVKTEYTEKK